MRARHSRHQHGRNRSEEHRDDRIGERPGPRATKPLAITAVALSLFVNRLISLFAPAVRRRALLGDEQRPVGLTGPADDNRDHLRGSVAISLGFGPVPAVAYQLPSDEPGGECPPSP